MAHVIIDTHEAELYDALKKESRLVVEHQPLPLFDVVIGAQKKTIGIEIKRDADFFQSMDDGRLKDQLERMMKLDNYLCVVLVQGDLRKAMVMSNRYKDHKYTLPQLWGMKASIMYNYGVFLFESKDLDDTVGQITYLALKDEKNITDVHKLRKARRLSTVAEQLQYVLEGLTGAAKAQQLLHRYHTIFDVFRAIMQNPDDVATLPGIGKKTIEKWRTLLITPIGGK